MRVIFLAELASRRYRGSDGRRSSLFTNNLEVSYILHICMLLLCFYNFQDEKLSVRIFFFMCFISLNANARCPTLPSHLSNQIKFVVKVTMTL